MDDVIIIGGSFAGLAAALQLGRARRKVTVLDTGLPRNRLAGHSHGLLGHDHKPPLDILAEARQQLARYPTIRLVSARADSVSGAIDDFSVLTGDGESLGARRLILSYGVADQMPDVPGFADSWGTSIVPCPYCDGFEVAGQHWGLVWSGAQSHQSVRLFHDWTDKLTLFADGHDIPPGYPGRSGAPQHTCRRWPDHRDRPSRGPYHHRQSRYPPQCRGRHPVRPSAQQAVRKPA